MNCTLLRELGCEQCRDQGRKSYLKVSIFVEAFWFFSLLRVLVKHHLLQPLQRGGDECSTHIRGHSLCKARLQSTELRLGVVLLFLSLSARGLCLTVLLQSRKAIDIARLLLVRVCIEDSPFVSTIPPLSSLKLGVTFLKLCTRGRF